MRKILFMILFFACSIYFVSQNAAEMQGVVDDSSVVTNFIVSLNDGRDKMMVSATRNKDSIIYTSFLRHQKELDLLKGGISSKYPSFRIFNYKGPEARYTLMVPNYNTDHNWYMLCPYKVRNYSGVYCILSGKFNGYVFEAYVSDLTEFDQIVSAIKVQSKMYVR